MQHRFTAREKSTPLNLAESPKREVVTADSGACQCMVSHQPCPRFLAAKRRHIRFRPAAASRFSIGHSRSVAFDHDASD